MHCSTGRTRDFCGKSTRDPFLWLASLPGSEFIIRENIAASGTVQELPD